MDEFDHLKRLLEGENNDTRKKIFGMYVKASGMKVDRAFILERLLAFVDDKYGVGARYNHLTDREKEKVMELMSSC